MNMKKMLAVVAAASLVAVAAPALAANPFSDVPLNHWAYDAVEQLASKGILEGYPNGTFKGNRAMTRYEIASMVARMMNAELEGADLDQLKALIVEFQPELEALGVKVDSFDARLAKLEEGVGKLRIWGQMRFDGRMYDEPEDGGGNNDNGFQMNRARIFMRRQLAQGLTWDMRWHADKLDRFYLTATDFMGVEGLTLKGGVFALNWEGNDKMYADFDAWFMDSGYRGFDLNYKNGLFEVEGFVASNKGNGTSGVYSSNAGDEFYGARAKFNFNEKLWLSLNGLWTNSGDDNWNVYWASLGYKITSGIELKGTYFVEDIADDLVDANKSGDDAPEAFKVILDIKQDVLKFTDLWAEYAHMDAGFIAHLNAYTYADTVWPNDFTDYMEQNDEDVDIIFVRAQQQWTKKFKTFLRYVNYDADDDATEWGVGIGYQYTPALYFELGWTDMDGRFDADGVDGDYDNQLIRLRTLFNF